MRQLTCPEDPALASPAGSRRRALCHLVMMFTVLQKLRVKLAG